MDNNNRGVRILIVDDDPGICSFFESAVSELGAKAKSLTKSLQVIDEIKTEFYNIVFLDIFICL